MKDLVVNEHHICNLFFSRAGKDMLNIYSKRRERQNDKHGKMLIFGESKQRILKNSLHFLQLFCISGTISNKKLKI